MSRLSYHLSTSPTCMRWFLAFFSAVYTTQEGIGEIKNNPQVYTIQQGEEEIKNNPQVYTIQEGIEEKKRRD